MQIAASDLLRGAAPRNASAIEARVAQQFIATNRITLSLFAVSASILPRFDGHVSIALRATSRVGAVPLKSPITGDVDHSLLISPRFGWDGVGNMLSSTGAKVLPSVLKLPLLPRSELGVPPWVISAVVLERLRRLLDQTKRQFSAVQRLEDRPRGRVNWTDYATKRLPQGRAYQLLCDYSALSEDSILIGAVHATVIRQIDALSAVRRDALIVGRLRSSFEDMRNRVSWAKPRWDGLATTMLAPSDATYVTDAIEAMRWTRDDRGLAGLSPLTGLPWILPMEQIFEAWVETLARTMAQRSGGVVRCGRLRQTLRPIAWAPPYSGSQRYLLPDVELLREDETIIFDAKYKSHWEEIDESRWYGVDDALREDHRADVLQVLAYAGATASARVTCVLLYPCHEDTWLSLVERRRFAHIASIPAGNRSVRLVLMAIPLSDSAEVIASMMAKYLFQL